jgi:hypothetical protein
VHVTSDKRQEFFFATILSLVVKVRKILRLRKKLWGGVPSHGDTDELAPKIASGGRMVEIWLKPSIFFESFSLTLASSSSRKQSNVLKR